ncbi:helix-turn-helix transcriptional regulator [Aquimarina sp. D1M17]|uniref:winged helix-turn-helix transcriptional regulator n=1 Tax=Aquimarina acroporae TaxID=2937283 RepID=UPI0020BDA943|nr:helix-turn-helix domain-containing protein [Aquimarina acroporae]MCK8523479.1 helix-turn-helix transcriptional regulator [Aquimarina acroporae]
MKAKKNENNLETCPVNNTLKIIGGKWRLRIIHEIGEDKRRFGELKRLIPEISEKMLIQELKVLVEYRILIRKAYKEIPPRVEYYVSERGKKVFPIIEEIKKFSNETN